VKRRVKYRLVCCWLLGASSLRAQTGLIGSVYSSVYGSLTADVEVTDEADASKRFAARTDDGIFRFPELPPGQYSIRVRAAIAGFHDPAIHNARIQPGMLTDVGGIRLFAACEDELHPGFCFTLSGGPIEGVRKIEMDEGCFLDLQEQAPSCFIPLPILGPISPDTLSSGDFWFHVADDGVWLVPFKGVSFSLNPSTVTYKRGRPNATYTPGPIRIDSLPPGSRACVRTHRGGYAELRFEKQIAPKQKTATVDFVYWDN
jgi:hypothetical protein